MPQSTYILAIESSCDDTAAAVMRNASVLSNIVADQKIHENYGGVVPELASRAHHQNIVPVVNKALNTANIDKKQLSAIAFTRGPGLLGSLMVGMSFAKSMALALQIPLIEVNHMQGHILTHFIEETGNQKPDFPFLALTVSGGHTQIVRVTNFFQMEIIGETLDDAAGEAFDKTARIMGLPYPGGPYVDRLAKKGNPRAFAFPKPRAGGLNFSFSGLKTAVLYFLQKQQQKDLEFIEKNLPDLCASLQYTIALILIDKLEKASQRTKINRITLGGGVAVNSGLRKMLRDKSKALHWELFLPKPEYTTDNAAMIGIVAWLKYQRGLFTDNSVTPVAKYNLADGL